MIHLIAEIKAHADRVDEVRGLLQSLLEPTRQEQGCCQYELFADNQIEGLFLMQEIWC
ncbi:antibiotic biosynthesis monooxygenase, partial [Vibrio vulnificus]|nr:antibiotic biosynthesis monooxygenase [Vibrio vulnificus]